jgi:serine/threonine-protein kinase
MEETVDESGSVVRLGRTRELGMELKWLERAFDYERPHRFSAEREFLNGPIRGYRLEACFESQGEETGIRYRIAAYSRWRVLRPLVWLILLLLIRPKVDRALKRALQSLQDQVFPQPVTPGSLHPDALAHLQRATEQISDKAVAAHLEHHLIHAAEPDQARLEPLQLAGRWGLPVGAVLDGCLQAVQAGILGLRWDLLCPSCRAAKSRLDRLVLEPGEAHCASCNIRYDADFADNVVVSFKTRLRDLDMTPQCIGNPSATPHILLRQDLQPGESRKLDLELSPGRYRLRRIEELTGALILVGEGEVGAVFCLEEHGLGPRRVQLQEGLVRICLENHTSAAARLALEATDMPQFGVTLAQILNRPEAMALMPDKALPAALEVEIQRQSVVTTEFLVEGDWVLPALRGRLDAHPPIWERVGPRGLVMGFSHLSEALAGLTRIVGCPDLVSSVSLGPVLSVDSLADGQHMGPALEHGRQALAISLPGGASLAQECATDAEVQTSVAKQDSIRRLVPGPLIRGRVDQLIEFTEERSWGTRRPPPPLDADQLLGRVFRSRYRIDAKLGEGGFGTVFTAVEIETDQDVVVKVLHPAHGREMSVSQGFFNEARACMALDSPFIVRMTDFGHTEDGLLFCVMDQLLGRALSDLSGKARTPDLVFGVCLDVLRGLVVVHEADLVHRDIKPANIFVVRGPAGGARGMLIDFGIAIHRFEPDPMARSGMLLGTAPYISPEQIDCTPPGPLADIYAVGMVFYECLAGSLPFPELSPIEQFAKRAAKPVPSLAEVSRHPLPPGLAALVDSALSRNPGERPASAADFARSLKEILR